MMKKLAKLTALFAVAALLFGAVGCSDDDDDDIAVTGVTLDKERLDIKVGGTEKFTATVTPADATDKDVTWSSENDDITTVDKDGIVTGVAVGNTTITVTTKDGNKEAVCEVTVTDDNNSGGEVKTTGNYIKFTTTKTSTVTVSFFQGADGRSVKIITDGDFSEEGTETTTANKAIKTTTFSDLPASTYYLSSKNSGLYISEVSVTE